MATAGLDGAAMAAPVVGYDAIATLDEEQHLRVPIIGRQGPAVAEHDRLAVAPVLVEDLNAVFGGDRAHVEPPDTRNSRYEVIPMLLSRQRSRSASRSTRFQLLRGSRRLQFQRHSSSFAALIALDQSMRRSI